LDVIIKESRRFSMSTKSESEAAPQKEPFFLSLLPFAGLALLLALAFAWRFVPKKETPAPPPPPEVDMGKALGDRWESAPVEEVAESPGDFTLGPKDAPVTLVEFSDFQCPFCRNGSHAVEEVLEGFPGRVRVVFKNFPLDTSCNEEMTQQLHPFACRAAVLARCAGAKRAEFFWKTHDAFFGADELSDEVLARIPRELGLGAEEIEACTASEAPLAKVKEDVALARKLRVTGTPTFFLNGRRLSEYKNGALNLVVGHVLSKAK
jgi:protein-disulfide isomerase